MKHLSIENYIIDTPLIDILKDIKSKINNGKLFYIEEKGEWIKITCPNSSHKNGKEETPDCGVYIGDKADTDYGYTHCFACGLSCNFIQCVAHCFDCSYTEAKKWLIKNYGVIKEEQTLELDPIVLNKTNTKEYLDEKILNNFESWHPYLEKRHLSPKVCETFKVKYDPKTDCIVFPVYDEYNKLYMLTRRSVKNKTFIIDKDKEKPVYLINYIKQMGIKEVTVVESQINALTAFSWGIPSVATFGCNITNKQIEIFNKSGINHIFLCYDGDDAGRKGIQRFIEKINKNIFVDVIIMDEGKDINDITEERFNQLPILSSDEWLQKYIIK